MSGTDARTHAFLARPHSIADFLAIKCDHPEAIVIGGGTIAVPMLHQCVEPPGVIHILSLPGLRSSGSASRGAGTTLATLAADPAVPPALREAASSVGGPALREMATVGGNIVAARPGCVAATLLALGGRADVLEWDARVTQLPLTAVVGRPDRLLMTVYWDPGRRARFAKATAGSIGSVVASVAVSVGADGRDWQVAVGGADMAPRRIGHAESLLPGNLNGAAEAIHDACGPRGPIIARMVRQCSDDLLRDRL
jgi:CO/xanthine dehydrogenase FAD-binding subunit